MKFQIISEMRTEYPVEKLANYFKISVSGFYKWLKRPSKKVDTRRAKWGKIVHAVFDEFKGRYGSPRITKELHARGYKISRRYVELLMRINQLKATLKTSYKVQTTDSKHDLPISPNLLNQNFDVPQINKVWVSDITYIRVGVKFLFLCIILDLANREVVGWTLSKKMNTQIVVNSLINAAQKRKPPEGLVFHSDRGSQYASKTFRRWLKHFGMIQSMSRKGNCYDNACAESFFHSLKTEEVYRNNYSCEAVARTRIFSYIEMFYNTVRRHSKLNFESPRNWLRLQNAV